jgi:hypothetical protein
VSFRRPFHAVPLRPGPRYRHSHRGGPRNSTLHFLGNAAIAGAVIGLGSAAFTETGRARLLAVATAIATEGGVRARAPQPGDYWHGCHEARAAGTAPIYRGEPGYREKMDGDNDGIACEPYR